jgi:hypothetical protein
MRNLIEGLRRGDLEDLVLPLLSVDEYESRIDDSAVVIAFFVNEKDAAQDLNRFIQRSPVELLDTEISPAPDSHGYFMVFVELLNNGKFGESVQGILEEISSLTMIDAWKMKLRGHDDLLPFDAETIAKAVADQEPDPVRESVLGLLANSDLLDARFEADTLVMESARSRYAYHLKAIGTLDEVTTQARILEGARLDFGAMIANRNLEFALGMGWSVYRFRDTDVLYHHESDRALALLPA